MVDTQGYWDGRAWTGAVAPAGPGSPSTFGAAPPNRSDIVTTAFAWSIAVVPLAWIVLAYLAPQVAVAQWTYLVALAVGLGLASADAAALRRVGVAVDMWWAALAGVAYLIARTVRAKSTPAIPIVWVATFAFSVLALTTFAKVLTLDQTKTEAALTSWSQRQGERDVHIHCPSSMVGRAGSTFNCSVTTSDVASAYFHVTMHGDGSITWVVEGA